MSSLENYVVRKKHWQDLDGGLRMYGENEPPEMQIENLWEVVDLTTGERIEEPKPDFGEFSSGDIMYPSMMKPDVKARWDLKNREWKQAKHNFKRIKRLAHAKFMHENPELPVVAGLKNTTYGNEIQGEYQKIMQQELARQQSQPRAPQAGTGSSIHDEMQRDDVDLNDIADAHIQYRSPQTGQTFAVLAANRDDTGRIAEKMQVSEENGHALEYRYDNEGRLKLVLFNGKGVEAYRYSSAGQRLISRSFNGPKVKYTYNQYGQLVQANDTTYRYDSDGDLVEKNESGRITRYGYLETGQLCEVQLPDGTTIEYRFDENGLRAEKYINGKLYQRYHWEDLTTLAAVEDATGTTHFQYNDHGNPVAMQKNNEIYLLATDQIGSIFVVADINGNSVQEILYDSFGRRIMDSTPDSDLYLGFGAGLHDRHTGLIHFGYREYDPSVGRFISPDPIGYEGGDVDVYGFCLDDPVNFVDRTGLAGKSEGDGEEKSSQLNETPVADSENAPGEFRFGKRPLEALQPLANAMTKIKNKYDSQPEPVQNMLKKIGKNMPHFQIGKLAAAKYTDEVIELMDKYNIEPSHEHGSYRKGDNSGVGMTGKMTNENSTEYRMEDKVYNGTLMKQVDEILEDNTKKEKYSLLGNLFKGKRKYNCQDHNDARRRLYEFLSRRANLK